MEGQARALRCSWRARAHRDLVSQDPRAQLLPLNGFPGRTSGLTGSGDSAQCGGVGPTGKKHSGSYSGSPASWAPGCLPLPALCGVTCFSLAVLLVELTAPPAADSLRHPDGSPVGAQAALAIEGVKTEAQAKARPARTARAHPAKTKCCQRPPKIRNYNLKD